MVFLPLLSNQMLLKASGYHTRKPQQPPWGRPAAKVRTRHLDYHKSEALTMRR